jgi:hypothetical protein
VTTRTAREARISTTAHDEAEFSFSSGGDAYADLDEYIAKGLVFTIKDAAFQPQAGYEGANRWAITVSPDDGRPDEIITLQSNEKRDAELKAAAAHIAKHGPISNTKLVKSGKAYYFRKADVKVTT